MFSPTTPFVSPVLNNPSPIVGIRTQPPTPVSDSPQSPVVRIAPPLLVLPPSENIRGLIGRIVEIRPRQQGPGPVRSSSFSIRAEGVPPPRINQSREGQRAPGSPSRGERPATPRTPKPQGER